MRSRRSASEPELKTEPEPEPEQQPEPQQEATTLEGEYALRHTEETVRMVLEEMVEQVEWLHGEGGRHSNGKHHRQRRKESYAQRSARAVKIGQRLCKQGVEALLASVDAWYRPQNSRWLGRLQLQGMRLTDLGAAVLASQLASSRLHTLQLTGCGMDSEGMISLAAQLPRCPVLHTLDLTGNAGLGSGLRAVAAASSHPKCSLLHCALGFNTAARQWASGGFEDAVRCFHEVRACARARARVSSVESPQCTRCAEAHSCHTMRGRCFHIRD